MLLTTFTYDRHKTRSRMLFSSCMSRGGRVNFLVSRRSVLQSGLAAGVGLALGDVTVAAQRIQDASDGVIKRAIPSTGELLPVIGLGTNQYSVTNADELAARREVLENFPRLGAKVVDTARAYGESEV